MPTSNEKSSTPKAAEKQATQDVKNEQAQVSTQETTETQKLEESNVPELKSVKDVTHEVLAGRWGANFATASQKLQEAGYNVDAVWAEFTRRKAGGAPSAF
jgi:hypothetical protein